MIQSIHPHSLNEDLDFTKVRAGRIILDVCISNVYTRIGLDSHVLISTGTFEDDREKRIFLLSPVATISCNCCYSGACDV